MSAEEQKLLDLAGRVSDGGEIDWANEEHSAPDEGARRLIRHLRVVQTLAGVHRSREGESGAANEPTQMTATIRPADLSADESGSHAAGEETSFERWGRLEIREKLGEGSFGEVYKAWDPNLQHEVALKLLKPRERGGEVDAEEFLREGRMLARLQHPNVITVHSAEVHEGRVGIWMELVRGRTLGEQIREQGRFGAREATVIGLELCRALAAVHGAGLVHRDIKAQNVMRGEGGRILLMDFGAGRELADVATEPDRGLSGTPLYMAPETVLGGAATKQSDIYSLGVLLYHLVTGDYPVRARSLDRLAERHRRREFRLLRDARSDLPDSFVKLVEKALAPEPERRFASAGEMEQALSSALGVDGGSQPMPQPTRQPRRTALWLVAATVALLAVAVAFVGWQSLREEPVEVVTLPVEYEVQAALNLYRSPKVEPERLAPGDRLEIGDRLALEFESSIPLYVYIFNQDEQGNTLALFPMPGFEPQNPLPPGLNHRLPGRNAEGEEKLWEVDSPGGREYLVVLASPERLVEYEAEMAKLQRPREGAVAVAVPEEAALRLRGIGGLADAPRTPETPTGASADQLYEMAHRLAGRSERVEGVWLRQIELLNPLPQPE